MAPEDQHARALAQRARRIGHVLEHLHQQDGGDGLVAQRQRVAVGDHVEAGAGHDVKRDATPGHAAAAIDGSAPAPTSHSSPPPGRRRAASSSINRAWRVGWSELCRTRPVWRVR